MLLHPILFYLLSFTPVQSEAMPGRQAKTIIRPPLIMVGLVSLPWAPCLPDRVVCL